MKKTGLMFSGGGAQYPGMMKDFYDTIPACRDLFEKANEVVEYRLSDRIFNDTKEELSITSVMIPAVFTSDLVAYTALKQYGIVPDMAAGFSLGEWAAITAAGVVPFETAIELVQFRSDEMTKATPAGGAGMAVIMGKPNDYVEDLCARVKEGYVCPANYNYPGQITVSGDTKGLDALEKLAEEEGTIYKRLAVNVPSHCSLMEPAMKALGERLKGVSFNKPAFPIVSNRTALPTDDPKEIKDNIITQLVSPVRFEQSIRNMYGAGVDTFIELGPGKTLYTFVKKISKNIETEVSVGRVENADTLNETLELLKK